MVHMRGWTGECRLLAGVSLMIAAGVLCPATASAQRLMIEPELGVYVSGGSLYTVGSIANPVDYKDRRPEGSFVGGFALWYWATNHLAVRGDVVFGPGYTAVTDTTGTNDQPSSTLLGTAQLIYSMRAFRSLSTVYVGAGAGMISWMGQEWSSLTGTTITTGVATIGITFPNRAMWAAKPYPPAHSIFTFELEDYISRPHVQQGPPEANQQTVGTRSDLTFKFGVAFVL
jgi:hypothetical protein